MPLRTEQDFANNGIKIRPDGSQEGPGIVSVEDAVKMQEEIDRREAAKAAGKTVDEVVITQPPKPAVEEKPGEKPAAASETPAEEDPLKDVTDDEIAAINAKLEKNEKLTDEEQAIADLLKPEEPQEFSLPEGVADEDITIGGETKKLSELFNEWQKERNIDATGLEYDAARAMLDDYLNTKHKSAMQASHTRRSQELAQRRAELDRQEAVFKNQKQQFATKAEKIKEKIKAAKELVAQKVEEIDIYDEETGRVDPKKLTHRDKVVRAHEQLPELEAELKEIEEMSAQTDSERLYLQLEALQQVNPLFQTSVPIRQAIAAFEQAKNTGSVPKTRDMKVVDLMYDIIDHAIDRNKSIEDAAETLEERGIFNALKGASPAPAPSSQPAPSAKSRKELIAEIRRKQAAARPSLGGGGSKVRPKGGGSNRVPVGDVMREHADRARGQGAQNTAVDKLEAL